MPRPSPSVTGEAMRGRSTRWFCRTSEAEEDLRRLPRFLLFPQTRSPAMNSIGVDLHKKIITVCVMNEKLNVLARKTLYCEKPDEIVEFFRQFRPFKVVVEATASYLWFVELVEPLAEKDRAGQSQEAQGHRRVHQEDRPPGCPGSGRVPGTGHDPPVLHAHAQAASASRVGPSPPIHPRPDDLRELQDPQNPERLQRRPQATCFSAQSGRAYLKQVPLSDADRFRDQATVGRARALHQAGSSSPERRSRHSPTRHRSEKRKPGRSQDGPWRGFVTTEVVISELGDVSRFRNAKAICAYAGLVPSSGKAEARSPRTCGSARRARGCCGGFWWKSSLASWSYTVPKWKRIL